MASWSDVQNMLAQDVTVYVAIKPRYPGSWFEDVKNISKHSGVSTSTIIADNQDLFSGAFPQNDVDYSVIVLNRGGDVPGPGPGPDPEPGDYVFDLAHNISPLPSGSYYVSQEYGEGGHGGTDMAVANGTAVGAVQQGIVVTRQDWDGHTTTGNMSWGNMLVIRHDDDTGNTFYTLYAHNSQLNVNVGETVTQGQTIALSGNSGNVSGSGGGYHLHLEVWVGGYGTSYRANPRDYVPI